MKIGLYFGSFNPIHTGHLIIANQVLNETILEKIWFVVTPQNPFKTDSYLLNETERLALVQLAILNDQRLEVSDVEFHLSKPSYTVHTLTYLKENYPDHRFTIIMGSDSFQNFHLWKNFEVIMNSHKLLIYRRPGFEVENKINAELEILDSPLLEISSTKIRELIRSGKSIRYLVPENVREKIEMNNYYK